MEHVLNWWVCFLNVSIRNVSHNLCEQFEPTLLQVYKIISTGVFCIRPWPGEAATLAAMGGDRGEL